MLELPPDGSEAALPVQARRLIDTLPVQAIERPTVFLSLDHFKDLIWHFCIFIVSCFLS